MRRAVQKLIRVIASGMFVFGVLEVGLELTRHKMNKGDISVWHCVIGTTLVAVGTVLFAISRKLAEQLTDDFE